MLHSDFDKLQLSRRILVSLESVCGPDGASPGVRSSRSAWFCFVESEAKVYRERSAGQLELRETLCALMLSPAYMHCFSTARFKAALVIIFKAEVERNDTLRTTQSDSDPTIRFAR